MDLKSLASINRANFAIKSYSIEHGYPSLRRSLVDDAKFETLKNKEAKNNWLNELKRNSQDKDISEEEVFIENENVELQKNLSTNVLLTLKNPGLINLYRVLKLVEISNGKIEHLETRKNFYQPENLKIDCGELKSEKYFDLFLNLDISKSSLLHLIKSLRHGNLADVTILKEQLISIKDPWFPRHIKELDFCSHILTKYEPDLDSDHPGFSDLAYRERRKKIADIAFEYKYGEEIPKIDYTKDEIKTWKIVYTKLQELYPTHACKQFNENFKVLEKECGYSPEFIPQLNDVSNFLKKKTGFTLRPAAGLLTARDFLSSLAFRVFQCTQYMRHSSLPHHSNEPDCVHELLGHVPMFVDPTFAQFSQEIGLASLGASDEDIEKFATLYWFTVEFGLCLQDGEKKAYGAGLLSSFGELKHALTDVPKHYPLDLEKASVQPYRDDIYNETYFIAESFQHARAQLRQFVQEKLPRKFEVHYDPFTQKVNIIDNLSKLSLILDNLNSDLNRLNNAVNKLKIVQNV